MSKPEKSSAQTLPQSLEKHLAAGEIEPVEEAWLGRLEEDPRDLPYFAAVARKLGRAGESETARFLLELLDEHLSEAGLWQERLELLRRVGSLLYDVGEIHPAILETLEKLYGDRPSYLAMVEKVGLRRAVDDVPKSWKKADRLATLLEFDVGAIVRMEGKGAGRVLDVNMGLESFKIAFEGGLELNVGFGGAAKLLEPLPPGHILRRKYEEPEALEKLRDGEPWELLRAVLSSYGGARTAAEIKRALAGVVPESMWSSWWTAARKHPQVVAAPGGRRYAWAASSEDAQGAIWQTFADADPRTRIDLLRRDGGRDPGLKARMSEALAAQAAELAGRDPGLACEIYFNLERWGEPGTAEGSAQLLIAEIGDPLPLFAGIRERAIRERAYAVARELLRNWPELYVQLVWQEQDTRALDLLARSLEESSPRRLQSLFDQITSLPKKNPAAFTWLAERAADRPSWLERNPIRLLKQILGALSSDAAFSGFRARLQPLIESGGTVPWLLSHLDEEQAADALASIEKSHGLQGFQRQPLLNAIHLRFPALRREEEAPLYATQESIDAKRAELKHFAEVEIPKNRRAIEEARELGDLSENFEYKSARQRHEYLSARAQALHRDLARVRRIDPSQVTGDEVVIGSRVELRSAEDDRWTLTILGPWESDPERDILSNESELARTLLGRKKGERADLAGGSYRIEAIDPYE